MRLLSPETCKEADVTNDHMILELDPSLVEPQMSPGTRDPLEMILTDYTPQKNKDTSDHSRVANGSVDNMIMLWIIKVLQNLEAAPAKVGQNFAFMKIV